MIRLNGWIMSGFSKMMRMERSDRNRSHTPRDGCLVI